MRTSHRIAVAAVALAAAGLGITGAAAQDVEATYADIEKTLGGVPEFMRHVPAAALPGAWAEMRDLQFSKDTALSPKEKELIGLAVAAQIPCEYCVYAHTAAAKANGASEEEIREAVGMAAVTRHWSTMLNGLQIDAAQFKKDFDAALAKPATD